MHHLSRLRLIRTRNRVSLLSQHVEHLRVVRPRSYANIPTPNNQVIVDPAPHNPKSSKTRKGIFSQIALSESFLTALSGVVLLFVGGIVYVKWYKWQVLRKIEKAFAAGYDPALDLASNNPKAMDEMHMRRREQDIIDQIVHGQERGHYFVITGSKGSGKGTMILDSMREVNAAGAAVVDVHPDIEVLRLRIGRALNYEFNEDSQTGVFQRRDPREAGPELDIERALNKLEKVALRESRRRGRPLVLIFNNIHYLKNEDAGHSMLLQLQQRAEAWAASGIMTLVFTTDEFWPYMIMRQKASRMRVVSVYDLDKADATHAFKKIRRDSKLPDVSDETVERVVGITGGRLSHISSIAKARDVGIIDHIKDVEKGWLLSQIGLIPDHDDDVMDEQKWSSCSWLLLQEFVKLRQEEERQSELLNTKIPHDNLSISLPKIPYWRCRQIMTRPDFLQELDRLNIISIDINHDVRVDSMMILHAAREVVESEGFQDVLDNVRARVDEIESLHRTRELTVKEGHEGILPLSISRK